MLDPGAYPNLVQFMDLFLYQEAEPTFRECILVAKSEGADFVRAVVRDIDAVLSADYSDEQIKALVRKHSDYCLPTGGRKTLAYIKDVLTQES